MQMLQQPHQIIILYAENHQVRQVRLNELTEGDRPCL
jgi:hypothetical protein